MPKEIRKPEIKPNQKKVRFSFAYFQPDHARFSLSECCKEYLDALLRELLCYHKWKIDDFMEPDAKQHRHPIDFRRDTCEKEGFTEIDPAVIWADGAWQFGISDKKAPPECLWRVHGFFLEETYYVVWLDPFHRLDVKEGPNA